MRERVYYIYDLFYVGENIEARGILMSKHMRTNIEWPHGAMPHRFLCLGMIRCSNYKQAMMTHRRNLVLFRRVWEEI